MVRAYAQIHAHKGILFTLFKWSAPRNFRVVNIKVNIYRITHTFPPPCVQNFDFPLPSPLRVFEMVVAPQQEYPLVCIGVSRGTNNQLPLKVNYINLNSNTSWFTNSGLGTLKSPAFELLFLHWCGRVCVCAELVCVLTETACPESVQVNQLDSSSLLVLIESKWNCHCNAQHKRAELASVMFLTFLPESVHIVGLEGEVKSSRHHTTFSHDIESIGENSYADVALYHR